MRNSPTVSAVLLAVVLAFVPAAASAVTVDQIVALSKAGVSEAIIVALIERDRTVLTIEPDQLVALQRDGVSERVILAMLKSGRAEGDEAARADSASTAATIMNRLSATPDLVVVGHGPDTPNTNYGTGFYSALTGPDIYAYPAPYAYGYGVFPSRQPRPRRNLFQDPINPLSSSSGVCYSQVPTGSVPPSVGSMGFAVPCPTTLQVQPRRRGR